MPLGVFANASDCSRFSEFANRFLASKREIRNLLGQTDFDMGMRYKLVRSCAPTKRQSRTQPPGRSKMLLRFQSILLFRRLWWAASCPPKSQQLSFHASSSMAFSSSDSFLFPCPICLTNLQWTNFSERKNRRKKQLKKPVCRKTQSWPSAPANSATLVCGESAAAQGLGALPL